MPTTRSRSALLAAALVAASCLGLVQPATAAPAPQTTLPQRLKAHDGPGFGATLVGVRNLTGTGFVAFDSTESAPASLPAGQTSIEVWDWSDPSFNEWTDYRVGTSGWTLRVRLLASGVDCRFRLNGYPADLDGDAERIMQQAAPFFCVNGAGTAPYVGQGTPLELQTLYVFPR